MTQAEPELNIDTEDDGLIEVYSLTLHDQGELGSGDATHPGHPALPFRLSHSAFRGLDPGRCE